MQYAILNYEIQDQIDARSDPKRQGEYWSAWTAYSTALAQAGVMVGGAGLHVPSDATTVRQRGGKRQVQDGPFADTKEQLGGFFLIEVGSLDDALAWAAKSPCAATGSVEVRPVLRPPSMPPKA